MEILLENIDNMNFIIKNENNFDIKINLKNEQIFFEYKNKNDKFENNNFFH